MQVRHPEALDGVGGHCPDRVMVGGEDYDCADGESFDVPEGQAAALANRYGVALSDIAAGDDPAESDVCGYYDDDAMDSPCSRDAGWGRDSSTGRCKDHVDL